MNNRNAFDGTLPNGNSTLDCGEREFEVFFDRHNTILSELTPNIAENEDYMSSSACESGIDSSECELVPLEIHKEVPCTDILQGGSHSTTAENIESALPILKNDEKTIQNLRFKCFKCELCDARFKTKLQLEWHSSSQVHKLDTFTCTICKQNFKSTHNSYFMHHLVFHAGVWDQQSEMF